MSEQDTPTEDDVPAQVDRKGQESDQQKTDSRRGGRLGSLVSGLALILAACALGLAVWSWLQIDQRSAAMQEVAEIQPALDAEKERRQQLDGSLESLQDSVSVLAEQVGGQGERLDAFESDLAGSRDELERVEQRLNEAEQELLEQIHQLRQRDDVQREVDRELDRHLLLVETAALLRLGQARAELANDFSGARAAYRRGGALLAEADDPRLGQVRRLLTAELDALEAVAAPDWLAAQARLERLARQVGQWPLDHRGGDIDDDAATDEQPEEGWMDTMRSALGALVRVRPRDETPISQEQLELIREALRLRLAAAELALGRRDLAELDHHLRRVSETLNTHFDLEDTEVKAAIGVIEELLGLEPATAPSELGGALARLREHMEQS